MQLAGEAPIVDVRDIVAIGSGCYPHSDGPDTPPHEIGPDLKVLRTDQLATAGPAAVGAAIRDLVGDGIAPFWLHVGIDVIDAADEVAGSRPVPTGITWSTLKRLLMPLTRSDRLLGIDVTDLNVERDPGLVVAAKLVDLLGATLAPGSE